MQNDIITLVQSSIKCHYIEKCYDTKYMNACIRSGKKVYMVTSGTILFLYDGFCFIVRDTARNRRILKENGYTLFVFLPDFLNRG